MSIRITITAIAAAFAIPAIAAAEMSSGAVTLGYQSSKGGGVKGHVLSFDGVVGANLGNNVSLNARANALRGKIDGVPGHATGHVLGLGLAYSFGNGGWAGAYVENGGLSASGVAGSADYTQYGVEGGFKFSGMDMAAFVGTSSDMDSIGITAKYAPGSQFQIGGGLMHTRVDTGVGKQGTNNVGLAGAMSVTDAISVFGGVSSTAISGTGVDMTSFGLGAGYDLGASLGNSVVSLELGRTNVGVPGGSGHMNTVRLGLTVPLGRAKAAVPQNSVAGAVLNPTKNTVSQTILSGF